MKLAFIGLGNMGFPMAGHLAKVHEVHVWNRTSAKAAEHGSKFGTTQAHALSDLSKAEVVITILPSSREVDEIVEQLAPQLAPGTLWIDCTSGDPEASRATFVRLAERSIEFVDAPVTGAVVGAENATLTIMVGGTAEGFSRAEPILRLNGKKIIHVGPAGAGHAIKALTNAMMGATLFVTSECLLVAKKFGIDPKTALEVTNAASGRSNASENLLPMRLVEGKWPLIFKLALHDKDIRIATQIAHRQHASTPLLSLTSQLFTAALHELGEEADYVEVAKFIASMNGTSWDA
jgi:3-hydroxyisobutyrate dehydrogenase